MPRTHQQRDKDAVEDAHDETFFIPALNETYTISSDSGNQSSVSVSLETSTTRSSESLSPNDYFSACSALSWLEEWEPDCEEDEGLHHAIKAVGDPKTPKLTKMGGTRFLLNPSVEPKEDQSDKGQTPVKAIALPKKCSESATMSKSNQKRTLSQNKLPRLPKPGEMVYSADGSPIVRHEIPSTIFEPIMPNQFLCGGAAPPQPPAKLRIRPKNSGLQEEMRYFIYK